MYYYIAMTSQRFQYYTAWCITDGSMIASGLGYNGQDPVTKEHKFDRIVSIVISEVELGLSPNIMIQVCEIKILFYPRRFMNYFSYRAGTI